MLRRILLVLTLGLVLAAPAMAVAAPVFPEVIPLPNGFQPEGIATGRGTSFFVGSIPTGAIYKGDLRTGQGSVLVQGGEGRAAIGLSLDRSGRRLYVAGGPTGRAFVYDTTTGEELADYQLTAPGTFINDVVVTRRAAYFTDSFRPVLYRVPVCAHGLPGDASAVETIPLSGDFQFLPGQFNLNGIDATPSGRWLVAVSSTRGDLYRINPRTGVARRIDIGDVSLVNGDGILLDGKVLYVVQNQNNRIAVLRLSRDLTAGRLLTYITDEDFRVPTTIAEHGRWLYAVNARFGTPPTAETEYEVVRVPKLQR